MTRWRTRHRGTHAERGAAAVEFAIVLSVLLLLVLGIIDFGRLLFVSQSVKSASREGARVAAVSTTAAPVTQAVQDSAASAVGMAGAGGTWTTTIANGTIVNGVFAALTDADNGSPNNTATTVPCAPAAATYVRVTVTVPFAFLTPLGSIPLLGGQENTIDDADRDITWSNTMRCE